MSLRFWKDYLPSAIVNWMMLVNIEKAHCTGEAGKKKKIFGGLIRNLNLTKARGPISEKKLAKTVWIKVGNLSVLSGVLITL